MILKKIVGYETKGVPHYLVILKKIKGYETKESALFFVCVSNHGHINTTHASASDKNLLGHLPKAEAKMPFT
jgi:hypothetical protein